MYLDLHITTPAATLSPARAKASDIVIVLDRSGSMAAENRLPYAKEAIRRLRAATVSRRSVCPDYL